MVYYCLAKVMVRRKMSMSEKAWFDTAVIRCPHCGHYYADASWYVIEIGSDIECGTCHKTFNTKRHITDRIMLVLKLDEKGRVQQVEVVEHV
jgi:hypothetical protein